MVVVSNCTKRAGARRGDDHTPAPGQGPVQDEAGHVAALGLNPGMTLEVDLALGPGLAVRRGGQSLLRENQSPRIEMLMTRSGPGHVLHADLDLLVDPVLHAGLDHPAGPVPTVGLVHQGDLVPHAGHDLLMDLVHPVGLALHADLYPTIGQGTNLTVGHDLDLRKEGLVLLLVIKLREMGTRMDKRNGALILLWIGLGLMTKPRATRLTQRTSGRTRELTTKILIKLNSVQK